VFSSFFILLALNNDPSKYEKFMREDNGDSILKCTTEIPGEALEAVVTIGD